MPAKFLQALALAPILLGAADAVPEERLGHKPAVCFTRNYDATHLAAHRQQTIRRIAVLKPESDAEAQKSWPSHKLSFRVELRDGRRFEKELFCNPEDYAYSCPHMNEYDALRDFYLTRAGDDHIMLRDRRAKLEKVFDIRLGADDRLFKLAQADAKDCEF